MADRFPRATDSAGMLLGDFGPGSRIGDYVVDAKLPTRGTGHLYSARHVVLPRRVTIKVMPAAEAWHRELAVELVREAYFIDSLDHPGIPRAYECGRLPDRRPWIAIEYVAGKTLAHVLAHGLLALVDSLKLVRDIAEILEHSHARGLVHHEVTPDAIVIPRTTRRFPVCLVDWAGARALDSTRPRPLRSAGPSPYTAPELRRGELGDTAADVYSLGVIARELVAKREPDSVPLIFHALADHMTREDPAQRPTLADIRAHVSWLVQEQQDRAGAEPITSDVTQETSGVIQS